MLSRLSLLGKVDEIAAIDVVGNKGQRRKAVSKSLVGLENGRAGLQGKIQRRYAFGVEATAMKPRALTRSRGP